MNNIFHLFRRPLFLNRPFLVGAVLVLGGSCGWLAVQTHNLATATVQPKPLVAVNVAPITTKSGPAEIALAEHLSRIGAKMYGAYWCPHCHDQKQLFGKEAWAKVPYIECAQDGPNADPQACNQAKVNAYPTWQVKNKRYVGATSLFRLARASNYSGPTNFKYTLSR